VVRRLASDGLPVPLKSGLRGRGRSGADWGSGTRGEARRRCRGRGATTDVLVVEGEALRDAGLRVADAASAEAALRAVDAAHEPPDVLVTAVTLNSGALDGRALAAELRRRSPGLGVVFLAGRPAADPADDGAALRQPAAAGQGHGCDALTRLASPGPSVVPPAIPPSRHGSPARPCRGGGRRQRAYFLSAGVGVGPAGLPPRAAANGEAATFAFSLSCLGFFGSRPLRF
jgi:CheY-like chemotaxis protein